IMLRDEKRRYSPKVLSAAGISSAGISSAGISIAHRGIVSAFVTHGYDVVIGPDLDHFRAADAPALSDEIPPYFQAVLRGDRKSRLDKDLVGQPLMVEFGGIDGFFGAHAKIEDIDKCLEDRSSDRRTAGGAYHEGRPAIVENDRGRHRAEHSFARGDGVCLRAHRAIHVRNAWFDAKIIHFVVQKEAGSAYDDLVAVPPIQGGGDRYRISAAVDHVQVRRLFTDGGKDSCPDDRTLTRFCRDERHSAFQIGCTDECVDRYRVIVPVAQKLRAVGIGQSFHLRHKVNRLYRLE